MSEKPIARGRTAEIYAWEAGKIVKVYLPQFPREDAAYEARIAARVQESGIACPRFYELIEFEGRPALVYERIDGATLAEAVFKAPWRIPQLARRMARLHSEMHQPLIEAELPTQREKLTGRIARSEMIPADLKKALLERLAALPDERRLCHGDFHPGNILTTPQRDLTIDWIDVSVGHPLADVARTSILLLGMAATNSNPFIKWVVNWFHAVYLKEYFNLLNSPASPHFSLNRAANGRPEWVALYRAYLPIVAAARLSEGIPELQGWLLEQANTIRA